MNAATRKRIWRLAARLGAIRAGVMNEKPLEPPAELLEIRTKLSDYLDDEQDKYDNLTDGLLGSRIGQRIEDAIDGLEDAIDVLDNVIDEWITSSPSAIADGIDEAISLMGEV